MFEATGVEGWTTQQSNDDGVDAVVVNKTPIRSGLSIVQAKRYKAAVGVSHVRELAGAMEEKKPDMASSSPHHGSPRDVGRKHVSTGVWNSSTDPDSRRSSRSTSARTFSSASSDRRQQRPDHKPNPSDLMSGYVSGIRSIVDFDRGLGGDRRQSADH